MKTDKNVPIYVNDVSKLQLRIYTLGYYPMGESIFVVLYESEKGTVLKSIFIDCFEQNGKNNMEDILTSYDIDKDKLDYIIWTHPDEDHSTGISSIIKKYTSKKTKILIPDGITKILDTEPLKSKILLIKNLIKGHIERVNVSDEEGDSKIYGKTRYSDGHNDVDFNIEILTPFATQTFSEILNKTMKKNDISISLIIRLANQNFYFGGDTENTAIKMIAKEKLHNIRFIKIPHHASGTSDYLPTIIKQIKMDEKINEIYMKINDRIYENVNDKIYENVDDLEIDDIISITTSFKNGNVDLPDNGVLDKYKKISSLILQTKSLGQNKNNFGIWRLIYNLEFSCFDKPKSYADASKYYSNDKST